MTGIKILLSLSAFCLIGLGSGIPKKNGIIQGTYHAWWVMVGVHKDDAYKMLNGFENLEKMRLTNTTLEGFPSVQHPVLFEIGKEFDCGPTISSSLRSDFLEFKFEIPFVTSSQSKVPVLNYKQRLFESSPLDSVSSKMTYGLDANRADMSMTENKYTIKLHGTTFQANFSAEGDSVWVNARDFPLLKPYKTIMDLTWFGRRRLGVCAQHFYDFDTALVRPSKAVLAFDKSLINPYFPEESYTIGQLGDTNKFGAVQIKVNFTMSLPEMCFK